MPKELTKNKRKRIVFTLKQKLDICCRLDKGESYKKLMEEYNVGNSTIYDIKAQRSKLKEFYVKSETSKSIEKRRTPHKPKMEDLDIAVYERFCLERSREHLFLVLLSKKKQGKSTVR